MERVHYGSKNCSVFDMCCPPQQNSPRKGKETQAPDVCGGNLVERDTLTLLCERCGTEYHIKSGIPHVLPKDILEGSYLQDNIIRKYYEMHFGPRIIGENVGSRLCFPQPNLNSDYRKTPKIESFKSVYNDGHNFDQSIADLVAKPYLTEDFYQKMVNLTRPLLNSGSAVLDIGCALGRMTAEISALGVEYVIGVDRSPRMTEEALKILSAADSIPITLNLINDHTVGAQLTPSQRFQNVDFVVGDAERLPVRGSSIDLALALNLLDRLTHPQKGIVEAARVIKPGGYLLVSHPYDWEEGPANRIDWVYDVTALFDPHLWRREREIDGVPFVMRGNSRRITIYLTHCLLYSRR